MFGNKLVFWWCCALLLVASSSKHQQRNLMNYNEKHDISTAQYKTDKNSIKSDKKDIVTSTISEFNKTDCNEDSNKCYVPHEICASVYSYTCFPACCQLDDHLTECIPGKIKVFHAFVEEQYSLQSKNQEKNLTPFEFFYDPCQKIKQFYMVKFSGINENVLITNGTVYFPYHVEFVKSKSFCLTDGGISRTGCNFNTFNINFPTEIVHRILIYKLYSPDSPLYPIIHHHIRIRISLHIISILFLLTTVLVYSILPWLRNKHGFILRNRISAKIVMYIIYTTNNFDLGNYFNGSIIDSVFYFGFLAHHFWYTVRYFDIWWTFRNISSLQTNLWNLQQEREGRKRGRKKLIIYSVCAWGIPFVLTIVFVIMDSIPSVMLSFLRPEISIIRFRSIKYMKIDWYHRIPLIICDICSIYFYISSKLNIRRYKKNGTNHLINADSRVYDKNRKWFNLCQTWFIMTFIVLGISGISFIGIISSKFPYTSIIWYISYIVYLVEMAENIGIFITFVCTKEIKELLLKRFGCQNYNVPPTARQTEVDDTVSNRTIHFICLMKPAFNSAMHVKDILLQIKDQQVNSG